MKQPDTWPQKIKKGNATVTIYRHENQKGEKVYTEFKVAYYDPTNKRRFQTFADYADALKCANAVTATVNKGEAEKLTLTSHDRLVYLRATDSLKPTGLPLDIATHQFADAHAKLAGRPLAEAVAFYMKRNPAERPSKTVQQAVADFIEHRRGNGASAIYVKDLNFRLGKFSEAFHVQLAAVGAGEINVFLRSLDCAQRGKANYKAAIRTLFKFATKEKWIPKDHVDWIDVDETKSETGEIEIFTPDEMVKLLAAAQLDPEELAPGFNKRYASAQGLLPLLVLGGFSGLRTAEVQRQLWSDILLDRGFIRVTAAKGNTAQKRLVPISDTLRKWIQTCQPSADVCCEYPRPEEAITRLAKRAGLKWKANGLRHSFISYRVAETQDVAKVSLEAGNSPKMIHRHYRELVTPDQAKVWFAIVPTKCAN